MKAPEELIIKIGLDDEIFTWFDQVGGVVADLGDHLGKLTCTTPETLKIYKSLLLLMVECPLVNKSMDLIEESITTEENQNGG